MFNRRKTTAYHSNGTAGVSIRWTDTDDDHRLAVVAARDSQHLPDGPWLVAEVEGSPLAVLSLSSGAFVADPFSRTVELRALLELRAQQLRQARAGAASLPAAPERARPRRGHRSAHRPARDSGAAPALLVLL